MAKLNAQHGCEQPHDLHCNDAAADQAALACEQQALQALESSRARMEDAQRSAQIGSWELDLRTNLLWWSPEIYRIFEIDPAYFGASYEAFLQLVHPADRELVDAAYRRAVSAGVPYAITHRLLMSDGRVKYVYEQAQTSYDANGVALRSVGTVQEITLRQTAEEARHQSETLYRTLIDALDVSLCRWLPDTTLVYANERYARSFGRQDDLVGTRWLELVPADTREATAALCQELCRNPRPSAYEHEVLAEDGEVRYFYWIDTPIFDSMGRLEQFQSVGIDVTERRLAEELAATQRDLARLIATVTSAEVAWARCIELALGVTRMDCGALYLFDARGQTLELVAHQGVKAEFVQATARYDPDTSVARLVLAGEPFYYAAEAILQHEMFQIEGMTCAVVMPIHHQGRILGCLNLGSHTRTQAPAMIRQALFTIAIEIGNLIVSLRTATALREREEQYRSLVDSQESAIATLDADGVFHFVNQI
jgi:PAS domain S-box-containing protein